MHSTDEKGTPCSGCLMLLCSLQAEYKGAPSSAAHEAERRCSMPQQPTCQSSLLNHLCRLISSAPVGPDPSRRSGFTCTAIYNITKLCSSCQGTHGL